MLGSCQILLQGPSTPRDRTCLSWQAGSVEGAGHSHLLHVSVGSHLKPWTWNPALFAAFLTARLSLYLVIKRLWALP